MYILHYGVGHDKGGHSGRYPWGSGENPKYPKKIYGGVDVTANKKYYRKTKMSQKDADNYLGDIEALKSAKKYMKKTGKFIEEHEMEYLKYKNMDNISRSRATAGFILTYATLPIGVYSRTYAKASKEYKKKYKYLNKYTQIF